MTKEEKKIVELLSDQDFRQWVTDPSEAQATYWQKWLLSHPEYKNASLRAKEIIVRLKFNEDTLAKHEQEEILDNVIASSIRKNKRTNSFSFDWYKVAAVITVLFTVGYLFYSINLNIISKNQSVVATNDIHYITKKNNKGVKSQIILPDGTKVYLNSESALIYPDQFTQSKREVVLSGEAYFDVAHDTLNPFSVKAKNTITTALGTSFNVQAFEDENIKVALVSGKVRVTSGDEDMSNYILNPGEKVVLNLNNEKAFVTNFNVLSETGWKDGLLTFSNSSFTEFKIIIERWFGVEVEVNGKPQSQWNIDGQFDNESLEEILKSVRYTHDVNFEINGKKIKISFD